MILHVSIYWYTISLAQEKSSDIPLILILLDIKIILTALIFSFIGMHDIHVILKIAIKEKIEQKPKVRVDKKYTLSEYCVGT